MPGSCYSPCSNDQLPLVLFLYSPVACATTIGMLIKNYVYIDKDFKR